MLASFILVMVAASALGHAVLARAKRRASLQPVRVRADRPQRVR
jgi:hypothetical protein